MRGRTRTIWWGVVIESADAHALARFYSEVLGWPIVGDDPNWVTIAPEGAVSYLAFNTSPDYVPPVWPAAEGRQQMMMHIDVAVAHAIELGATLADFQPQDTVRVMLDPAGHPFCLYLDT
jgi:catechol 2,3-dioxygenase-like lactoylglutathione lyase family enzyme